MRSSTGHPLQVLQASCLLLCQLPLAAVHVCLLLPAQQLQWWPSSLLLLGLTPQLAQAAMEDVLVPVVEAVSELSGPAQLAAQTVRLAVQAASELAGLAALAALEPAEAFALLAVVPQWSQYGLGMVPSVQAVSELAGLAALELAEVFPLPVAAPLVEAAGGLQVGLAALQAGQAV